MKKPGRSEAVTFIGAPHSVMKEGTFMKHRKRLIHIAVFTFIVGLAGISYAGIANTVHNMSVSSPGTIKATAETEICIFCHIPHNAPSVGRPLWNHDMPATGYTMYGSDYLARAGYAVPSGLGTATGTPGMLSRQCLSCHDGTVAAGAVYAVRGTVLGTGLIAMSGVAGSGTMQTTATGFIGGPAGQLGDLTRHHPVGIVYDATKTIAFGSGSRSIELVVSPSSAAIKLYNIGAANYVECSSCHDPHVQNQKFMRDTAGVTFAAKIDNTCNACHNKTGWTGSIHQSNGSAYSDPAVNTTFGANTITSLACMNCHMTHKGLGAPYLLRQAEETACFQGASGTAAETACHGSSSSATTNRIQTVITRAYKHPTTTISGVHTNLDVLYPAGGTPAGSLGLYWSNAKHAECVDCHNPHRATNAPARVAAASWYPALVDGTSNQTVKSGALTGVSGVQPTAWPALWTVPTTFTTQESSAYEYQICFKCHSYLVQLEEIDQVNGLRRRQFPCLEIGRALITDLMDHYADTGGNKSQNDKRNDKLRFGYGCEECIEKLQMITLHRRQGWHRMQPCRSFPILNVCCKTTDILTGRSRRNYHGWYIQKPYYSNWILYNPSVWLPS
jgi:hypothetical protein